MINLEQPSVNVTNKTNEENIQSLKAWALELVGQLEYQISQLESTIASLQLEIESLKGE